MKNTILAVAIAGVIGAGTVYAGPDLNRRHLCDHEPGSQMQHGMSKHGERCDDDADPAMGRMMREMDLSDAQRKELKVFREEQRESGKSLRKETLKVRREIRNLDPEDKNYLAKLEKLSAKQGELTAQATIHRGKMRVKFHSILSAEQRQQLLKKRDEMRQRRLEHIKQRRQELQELEKEAAES